MAMLNHALVARTQQLMVDANQENPPTAIFQVAAETKRPQQIPDRVNILVSKIASDGAISGIVEVIMNRSHSGLFIELCSTLKYGETSVDLIVKNRTELSPTFRRLCGIRKAAVKADLFTFIKFPFVLNAQDELPPPPTFDSALFSIEHKLVVLMKKYGDYVTIKEKVIQFPGQLEICRGPHLTSLIEQEVRVDGVKVAVELPRDEFLISESIPFTVRLLDSLRVGVKKVEISLLQKVRLDGENDAESRVLDCVTFKRFLKREMCERRGKFSGNCVKVPSYCSTCDTFFSIGYEIEIQIVTMDLKTASGSIPVTLGTVSKAPIPSTVPREGDEYDAALAQIPRRRSPSFLSIRSMSLLSIFPPSYSQLGSRRSSIASIQTLPPHYDDVVH